MIPLAIEGVFGIVLHSHLGKVELGGFLWGAKEDGFAVLNDEDFFAGISNEFEIMGHHNHSGMFLP